MSLFPMNRGIRRAARCRCMVCSYCDWREDHYTRMTRDHDPRPLQTLVKKEKEIAMPAACSSAGEALNRRIEVNKLKARLLFQAALSPKSVTPRERAELLAQHIKYRGPDISNRLKIQAVYPEHEIIVEMNDGTLFTIDTDATGWTVFDHGTHTAESYLKYHGWSEIDIEGSPSGDKGLEQFRVTDLFLPGAKAIYAIDM